MTELYKGFLEVDRERGVIYFHLIECKDVDNLQACTLLRICQIKHLLKNKTGLIDIHKEVFE